MELMKFENKYDWGYDYKQFCPVDDVDKFKPNGMSIDEDCQYYDIPKYINTYLHDPIVHPSWENFRKHKKLVSSIRGEFIYPVEQFGALDKLIGQDSGYEEYCFLKHIKPSTMKRIRKGQGKIVVLAPEESMFTMSNMVHFHNELKKYKVPKCHYITGNNWTIRNDYESWCKKGGEEIKINVINSYQQMHLKGWDLIYPSNIFEHEGKNSFVTEDDFDVRRQKRFVCLNRRIKPHRYALIGMFHKLGLLKDNLVSFSLESGKDLNHYSEYSKPNKGTLIRILGNTLLNSEIRGYYDELLEMSPRTVDYPDIQKVIGPGCESKEAYIQTYFSVVTETAFDNDKCWFSTEKVYRPMLHLHPFIVYGSPYTLRELRKKGFKTFSPFIDESYDECELHFNRFKKIIKEVERLCSMSDDEIHEWYNGMKDILIHNRNLLEEYGKQYYKVIPKILGDIK